MIGTLNKQATKFALNVIKQYELEEKEPRQIQCTEEAFLLQCAMIESGLTLPLDACVVVSKKEVSDIDKIKEVILSVISKNEIFNYKYERGENIILQVMSEKKQREIMTYEVLDRDVLDFTKVTNNMLKKHLNKCVWGRELFVVYIVSTPIRWYVNFVMSHIIADPGVNTALNLQFRKELRAEPSDYVQYRDYVKLVKNAPFQNEYTDFLEECLTINNENSDSFDKLVGKQTLQEIPSTSSFEQWYEVLLENAYVIGKRFFDKISSDKLVMKVSCNYRNVLGEEYQYVIGDCHSLFFVMMEREDFLETFCQRNEHLISIIKDNNVECGYRTLIEGTIYEQVYSSTVVNINLVTGGFYDAEAIKEYLKTAKELNNQILDGKVIRIDSILFKKKFYLYLMEPT